MAKHSAKKETEHIIENREEKDKLNEAINPNRAFDKIEEALHRIDILTRIPDGLKNDAWVSILHHYEQVIVKNLSKLEE